LPNTYTKANTECNIGELVSKLGAVFIHRNRIESNVLSACFYYLRQYHI